VAALATSGGVLLIASLEAGGIRTGAAFAAGLGLALGALWLAAGALRAGLRRGVSPRLPYTWRQGLANLYRPANQTLAVALSLGFGAFLLGTLLALQSNLLRELRTGEGPRSNLAFFDIQPDQLESVVAELKQNGADPGRPVPIVPMRIDSVKGIPASQKLAQAAAGAPQRSPAWLLRREFRSTYRAQKTPTEELTAGAWWSPDAQDAEVVPVSLEVEMAKDLGVAVGDEIVWDVQGVLLKSRVANLRRVEWARFEPNFFAVFPDGPLRAAPQSFVTLLRIDDGAARARLMRLLSERFSNISALDLADIQKNLEELLAKLAWAVRFLAMFSVATGTLVLLGALAASRLERLREAVLLKTLGATRRQVARVILAEYAALGVLAGATGVLLAGAASWALVRFLFESSFSLPTLPLLGFGAGVVALTLALGASGSIEVFRKTSLELLRNE
jgi:putative ABC transport system permease protein